MLGIHIGNSDGISINDVSSLYVSVNNEITKLKNDLSNLQNIDTITNKLGEWTAGGTAGSGTLQSVTYANDKFYSQLGYTKESYINATNGGYVGNLFADSESKTKILNNIFCRRKFSLKSIFQIFFYAFNILKIHTFPS